MGEAKRRKISDSNYGRSNHPKVNKWIQTYIYPMFDDCKRIIFDNRTNTLKVCKIPCCIPTQDAEILDSDQVKFKYNLMSYQEDERLLCYLQLYKTHHLFLIDNFDEELVMTTRDFIEIGFNWVVFLSHIRPFGEGYFRLDHINKKSQPLGSTWDEACTNLEMVGHILEPSLLT